MKNKNKITKGIAIGLFVLAFLLNVSLTFDSGNSQNADLSIGSLKVSLFQKAYSKEVIVPGMCVYNPNHVYTLYGGGQQITITQHRNA